MRLVLKIRTHKPSKIAINDYSTFLNTDKHITLEIEFNDSFYIQVTPIDDSNKNLPFIAKFDIINNILKSESEQITIINLCDKHYEIIINPKNSLNNISTFNFKRTIKNPNEMLIEVRQNLLIVKSQGKIKTYFLNNSFKPNNVKSYLEYLVLYNKNKSITYMCLVNTKKDEIHYFNCNSFSIKNNVITFVNKINDYSKHLKIKKYDFNDFTKPTENYTAYKTTPKVSNNKNIIPYIFLQNIKVKDYKQAIQYLSTTFGSNTPPTAFNEYFGNFEMISTPQIKIDKNVVCLNYKEFKNYYTSKYFKFEFDTLNKINNIYEIRK